MKAIFVIAGHGIGNNGASDNGANFKGISEREEVVQVADEVINELLTYQGFAKGVVLKKHNATDEEKMKGDELENPTDIQVIDVGVYESITKQLKVDTINKWCNDFGWGVDDVLCIYIHANSASNESASGVECWIRDGFKKAETAAKIVQSELVKSTGFKDRGVKSDLRYHRSGLYVLRNIKYVGVLAEIGFITNDFERMIMSDPEKDNVFAQGIVNAILKIAKKTSAVKTHPTWYMDVPEDVWYANDLKFLLNKDILKMPKHGKFNPTPDSVRCAVMVARAYKKLDGLIPN